MDRFSGSLAFEYEGAKKTIDFSLAMGGYGGLPFMTIKAKSDHHHSFARRDNSGWASIINVEPNWPKSFLALLYQAFEDEYQKFVQLRLENLNSVKLFSFNMPNIFKIKVQSLNLDCM